MALKTWCHLAFAKDRKLHFALLSDFEPKGEVARAYGVYRKGEGVSERALFVIDKEGIIRLSHVSAIGINPGAEGYDGSWEPDVFLESLRGLLAGPVSAGLP